jgi:hypothetical protein
MPLEGEQMKKPTGYIVYEGPSQLDGAPIVMIATVSSNNAKTGGMVQTWIMRADMEPTEALKSGRDASVCGSCIHRPINGGACYVTVFQAPLSVYKAYKRGRYPHANGAVYRHVLGGRAIRLGSYGDPAAIPRYVLQDLTAHAEGITGYTHQWRTHGDAELSALCMASCDSESDRVAAKAQGFRTFRVRMADGARMVGEVVCPASDEAGNKLDCATCQSCDGNATGRRGDVVIMVHGAVSKVQAFARSTAQGQALTA